MKTLVAYGSRLGGTAGIAEIIGDTLHERGIEVDTQPAGTVKNLRGYDAIVVGGALYAYRWHKDARSFLKRHARTLGDLPVWAFSSGPLDDSASERDIPPTRGLAKLLARVGTDRHRTFGGRIEPDAGFPGSQMAKTNPGDWRDREQIHEWADSIASDLLGN